VRAGSIGDNGIGIDPKFAERIFAIFQRLPTRQECAGAGVSAVCKRIVDATADTFPNRGEIEKIADLTDENAA
jgi:light-regulated signal transduction histidine kinase (bacteriophytochrome)